MSNDLKGLSREILKYNEKRESKERAIRDVVIEKLFGEIPKGDDKLGKPVEVKILGMEFRKVVGPLFHYSDGVGYSDLRAIEIDETEVNVKIILRSRSGHEKTTHDNSSGQ